MKATLDTVNEQVLWATLADLQVPSQLIQIIRSTTKELKGLTEATVHAVATLGAINLEYCFWRVNGNSGDAAPNVSGMHGR
ncbi:hypothetical protein FQA39_LY06292 [Lamprigera yunnana]|nr:hypothetical protein FQA39_LY06292 [Lamprigera yunnana]